MIPSSPSPRMSWDHLVHVHHRLAYGIAFRILGDASAAEDSTQDLFLHFLQNPRALDGAENVRAFICRAAINRALDRLRERERRERREATWAPAVRQPDPLDAASMEEIRRRVDELPPGEREAVHARFFRGLTVRETARELEVSVGTVCNRLGAAVKRLRRWMGAAAFALLCGVLDDEALAEGAPAGLEVAIAGRGVGGSGGAAAAKGGSALVAAGVPAAIAAAVLIGLWVTRPDPVEEDARTERGHVEIAAAVAPPSRATGDGCLANGGPALEVSVRGGRRDSVVARETFRAEGFLVRTPDGLTLAQPDWRGPLKAMSPAPIDAAGALPASGSTFDIPPDAGTTVSSDARPPFVLDPHAALATLPASPSRSFAGWLDGAGRVEDVPRARVAIRARWTDGGRTRAAVVAVEEVELLGRDWLAAWRDALAANGELARAFLRPPGALRRGEALAAADRMEEAIGRAAAARAGDAVGFWRSARESEIRIASGDALLALGREGVPSEPPGVPDAPSRETSLAAARECGLELEDVHPLERAALALRGGARVTYAMPGSPAERLAPGDLIWRITPASGDRSSVSWEVFSAADVGVLIESARARGWECVVVEVVRAGEVVQVRVAL